MLKKRKNILILGGSSDIGISLIQRLDTKNYNIGAHCFKGKSRLTKFKNKITILEKNLDTQKKCFQLINQYKKKVGLPDILINLIGEIGNNLDWRKISESDFENIIKINLNSAIFVSQKIFETMKKNKYGKFIFTSTGSVGKAPSSSSLVYGLAKAGIENFSKFLAKEGGKYNIISNCISPGFIKTRLHTKKLKKDANQIKLRSNMNVLKRYGRSEEVAHLMIYLISDKSNFITGENIPITGGDWL
tara:strand:- start:715 stop:1452 length:738 start_codon:yes stop_codon:yes gene_type:complete